MADLDALGDRDLPRLREGLGAERRWSARFAIVERFLAVRLSSGPAISAGARRAYEAIVRSGGTIPVGVLAREAGWSRKHLGARFREEVGLGPKTVARIARFGRAKSMARTPGHAGWADIAAACGYADQAHLVREFAAFAGATPSAWREALAG